MSIYEEQDPKTPIVIEKPQASLYEALNNQLGTLLDYEDSVIFINDEINDHTLTDFIIVFLCDQ